MKPLRPRTSLVTQARDALRDAILRGEWQKTLPGEIELCRVLHVSRVTLRGALAELEREGLIGAGQGRRRRIELAVAGSREHHPSKRIIMLSPQPLHYMGPTTIAWIEALRKDLAQAGYQFEVVPQPSVYSHKPRKRLERWLADQDAAGLLLYRTFPVMQEWFAQCGRPCVIAGSRAEGVPLPSVDIDYDAVCRHAVGRFVAAGHQQLAFLVARGGLVGDLESERSFRSALELRGRGATAHVVHHNGFRASMVAALEELQTRSPRPTAYLVAHGENVVTAMGFFMSRGLRFGRDVALISRDDDSVLAHAFPSVARYTVHPGVFAYRFSRLLLEAVGGGKIACPDHRLIPDFITGETLTGLKAN